MTVSTHARRLHRDDGGQISFLAVFGAVALAALLGLVMTTGDQVTLKVRTQNAADAAALSGGAWIARGLNVTSAGNVAQTQLVAGAILLEAFHGSLRDSRPFMIVQLAAFEALSLVPGAGIFFKIAATIVRFQLRILAKILPGLSRIARFLARCPSGLFWKTAQLLETVNRVVHSTFFVVAFGESLLVARANGAEAAVFLPGPAFHGSVSFASATLPTRDAPFAELCPPMTDGSPTPDRFGYGKLLGYPQNQGPFKLGRCRLGRVALLISGLPPVAAGLFPLYANLEKASLCGEAPDPAERTVERPARDLEECRRLDGQARWRVARTTTGPVSRGDGCGWLASELGEETGGGDPASRPVSRPERSCRLPPPGREVRPGLYCRSQGREATEDGKFRHELETWSLESAWVDEEPAVPSPSGSCDDKPQPFLLRNDPDALRFLAVAYRPNRRIFFTGSFLEEPPELVAYAQVEVYNGVSEDTFTQDWRVRLERASLLERPFQAFDESRFASGMNRLLAGAGIDPVQLTSVVGRIGNH